MFDESDFIWTDLSTFDLNKAKDFYSKAFGWEFFGQDYLIGSYLNKESCGIYKMPKKFEKMNLPSFWMSYIFVENIDKVVSKAKKFDNVIVEIEPSYFDENSKIALIRDPSGAGFTVYQGDNINSKYDLENFMNFNVLHINDIKLVKDFYESVFEWNIDRNFECEDNEVYNIFNENGKLIGNIEVFEDSIKGKYQYWMPIFRVCDISKFEDEVLSLGGEVLWRMSEKKVIFMDNQGASFLVESK